MADFKLRKGYDIRITGKAASEVVDAENSTRFAIKPIDFKGMKPKLNIEVGAKVKAGTPLFHEKEIPEIVFTSPVSGTVVDIVRGERRYINEIIIDSDGKFESEAFTAYSNEEVASADVAAIKDQLLKSGLWASFIERPYGRFANPKNTVRDVFISAMDTNPLAADPNIIVDGHDDAFQMGIDVLNRLTEGKVYLSLNGKESNNAAFTNAKNVEKNTFSGPHPAGNVGIQIHHIKPINRGEKVLTIKPADVVAIGYLFSTGKMYSDTIVAVAGENASTKKYYKTKRGVQISSILGEIAENSRIVSGNPLTGRKSVESGFVGFFDNSITVLPEGNFREFLGWVLPGLNKESFSKTFLGRFFPKKEYHHNTNLHGGHRAFVQTGYYEQVIPMDMYPVHLLKSILFEDLEQMEGLGIYEVIEEDFAICEFICPSKIEVQEILREGIDLMIKEM